MIKKFIKYILSAALLLFILYNSVYFKKLDAVKNAIGETKFDAKKYASDYYNKLVPVAKKSVELNELLNLLKTDPGKAFDAYGNALGIGNIKYFLVQGNGVVRKINESDMSLLVKSDSSEKMVNLATEFVFGNAIRDASGIIKINEFNSTTDLNNVSAEVNKIVREQVLPPFKSAITGGDTISFTGAIELNQKFINLEQIEVVPITLNLKE